MRRALGRPAGPPVPIFAPFEAHSPPRFAGHSNLATAPHSAAFAAHAANRLRTAILQRPPLPLLPVAFVLLAALLILPPHLRAAAMPRGRAEHVVVVVWDGLRPDFVSPQHTPTLHELARRGTFFHRHHAAYVTSTEVNGTALATGAHPGHGGILANVQYRSDLGWLRPYGTEQLDAVRRGDLLSGGRYLALPTLAELLHSNGIPTITAGAKPVTLLHDRAPRGLTAAQSNSINLFRGQTLPRAALSNLVANPEIGPPPTTELPPGSTSQERLLNWVKSTRDKVLTRVNGQPKTPPLHRRMDSWTTRALVHGLWKSSIPKYTLLWLSEPDASQHETAPGSPNALAALAEADRHLALLIQTLRERGVLDVTDILVVSDHGFSTVDQGPDLAAALRRAKFVAGTSFDNPEPGDVLTVNLGGSSFLYVFDHHRPTLERLVEFLQGTDFAGVIFSSIPLEGTFPIAQAQLDAGPHTPDVIVSMRWTDSRNAWGVPGMLMSIGGRPGSGAHGSLSPFDLRNTLIAAGPDFHTNLVSQLPSGNLDLAPTILALLGLPRPAAMDGRVLVEALVGAPSTPTVPETKVFEATRDLGYRRWRQTLAVSRLDGVVYFDHGNGESSLK